MSDAEAILTLRCGSVEAIVHPDEGARIGQITVGTQPLLVEVPPLGGRHAMAWGCFPMVPWAGRVRSGWFVFDGVERQLAINHLDGPDPGEAHAIHGLGFDRPWDVTADSEGSCTCSISLDWEFGGTATHTVALFEDRIVMTLTVESTGTAFPAEIGWHPWFPEPERLSFTPAAMYESDRFGLPTGALVEPTPGPWDDCFVNTEPVGLHYARRHAPTLTITSGCDHVVVFDEPADATCVEPQSGPPDAFNLDPHLVRPGHPLTRTMSISW
jgi:aldose 1-epimerase